MPGKRKGESSSFGELEAVRIFVPVAAVDSCSLLAIVYGAPAFKQGQTTALGAVQQGSRKEDSRVER